MIPPQDDEETPLLQRPEQPTAKTPLPWDQFWILLLLEMPDFLSSRTLAPFIPQLIRDIGVTHGDESQVGRYVGILQLSSSVAHTLTIFHWSRLSDYIGRKPVLLTALLAHVVSMFAFGLSKSFLGLVVSCVVCGAFDPGDVVIKTLVMDITDATNMPKAFSYMPIPVMIGTTVGSLIGGFLSRPTDRFPDIFGRSELLKTYPYLLPCSISAFFISIIWLVACICLKESVSTRTPLWELVKGGFFGQSYSKSRQPSSNVTFHPGEVQPKPLPLRALLTSKVLTVTASYATMGLFHMALSLILPVFYATPIELGGLSLDPPRIGALLAASSIIQGIFQLLLYARLHHHFGARAIHITGVSSGIPIVILFPVTNALARAYGIGVAVWLCVVVQLTLKTSLLMCFPCLTLFIRAAAPNRASLGATTGIAQVALAQGHDAWSIYYFFIAIVFLAVGTALLLPRDLSPSLLDAFPNGTISYFSDRVTPFLLADSSTDHPQPPMPISTFATLAKWVCAGPTSWAQYWGTYPDIMEELEGRPEWCLDLTFQLRVW
ncbi:major facilitator superfamily domain-containing protein [Suillus discolor]|uniref:Major facilitator superfamily domain-containing protein n=1 Tax=Suillus discolor TaxID=1912936 RepID=A0A9P7F3T7_9AGAM|nr:major facilitator superfamily domain-containing protein [Suillus discolor]KAG2106606.1 major facilitator superfamily domain-containing protein [Suillus discolor]